MALTPPIPPGPRPLHRDPQPLNPTKTRRLKRSGSPTSTPTESEHSSTPANPTGHSSTHSLHPQTMLLCVSSRDLVEVLLVALGELAVVAQASFEG